MKTEFYNPLSLSLSWFLGDVKFYSADRGEKLIKQASDIGNGNVVLVLLPNVGNHLLLELGVLFDLASSTYKAKPFQIGGTEELESQVNSQNCVMSAQKIKAFDRA